jgi:hypothetical protein
MSRRSRQGLATGGVIAAIALSLYLFTGGLATSQLTGGTPAASPMASPQADDPRITIEFTELNDSGVTGEATLYAQGDRTIVEIDLEGTGEDHPAHIHTGTCDDIQPEPEYNLENVGEEGTSTSEVDVPLDDLIAGDYVIDLHLAANQLGTLIVCGDIEGQPTNAADTPVAVGGQGDATETPGTETATATSEPVTPEPTTTQPPTAAPTAAPVATEAPAPTSVATAESTAAPASPEDDDVTDDIGGVISDITGVGGDGTQGSLTTVDSGKGSSLATSSGKGGATTGTGDGTQGALATQSGKGGAVTTNLPASTGAGTSLIFPDTAYRAAFAASGVFSVILFAAAVILRRGETRYATGRWRRLGL